MLVICQANYMRNEYVLLGNLNLDHHRKVKLCKVGKDTVYDKRHDPVATISSICICDYIPNNQMGNTE